MLVGPDKKQLRGIRGNGCYLHIYVPHSRMVTKARYDRDKSRRRKNGSMDAELSRGHITPL